jgi:hypothetical protein
LLVDRELAGQLAKALFFPLYSLGGLPPFRVVDGLVPVTRETVEWVVPVLRYFYIFTILARRVTGLVPL